MVGTIKMVRLGAACLMLVFGVACVTAQPKAPEGRVVESLSVAAAQKGQFDTSALLRWGGTIVGVELGSDNTLIEVVSRPLAATGRPQHNDISDGRFKAQLAGFIDPEIFQKGRDVSFTGSITHIEQGTVGKADYAYPLMAVNQYRMWQKLPPENQYEPLSDSWYRDPFWRGWPRHRHNDPFHGVFRTSGAQE